MAFFSNLKITNCGQKGRIVVASRAFVYTNAIFALQNACWAVPNPLHSAPFRCRPRVFSKRFYLYKVELQDICTLQFWWKHLKPNEQPATASTVSEAMMLAVLRSERKTFDISAGSWYTTSNPCESVGGDCVAFPVLSCSWRSKQRRTISPFVCKRKRPHRVFRYGISQRSFCRCCLRCHWSSSLMIVSSICFGV